MSKPYSEWTPVEVDTDLARLYGERAVAAHRLSGVADSVKRMLMPAGLAWHARQSWRYDGTLDEALVEAAEKAVSYERSRVERYVEEVAQYRAKIAEVDEAIAPLQAEYRSRPWSRAFLAASSNGHVHKSRECSTCYPDRFDIVTGHFKPGTEFYWMTEYSGKDEADIVHDAGERACTVCYPSAPVADLSRPTKMFSPAEVDKAKAKAEREAKKAEREAAKVTLDVYDAGWRRETPTLTSVTWKSVRALQNDLGALVREYTGASAMVNGFRLDFLAWNDKDAWSKVRVPVNREEGLHNIRVMAAALTERGVDAAAVIAKAHKRAVKEGGTAWDGVL